MNEVICGILALVHYAAPLQSALCFYCNALDHEYIFVLPSSTHWIHKIFISQSYFQSIEKFWESDELSFRAFSVLLGTGWGSINAEYYYSFADTVVHF